MADEPDETIRKFLGGQFDPYTIIEKLEKQLLADMPELTFKIHPALNTAGAEIGLSLWPHYKDQPIGMIVATDPPTSKVLFFDNIGFKRLGELNSHSIGMSNVFHTLQPYQDYVTFLHGKMSALGAGPGRPPKPRTPDGGTSGSDPNGST